MGKFEIGQDQNGVKHLRITNSKYSGAIEPKDDHQDFKHFASNSLALEERIAANSHQFHKEDCPD